MNTLHNSTAFKDISHFVHPFTNFEELHDKGPFVVVKGDGVYVEDSTGRRYLEGMAGLWCASLGFSEPRIADAAKRQLLDLGSYHTFNRRSNLPAIELAERLTSLAPNGLTHAHFANSGSEANDQAMKIVWYYNNALGRPRKKKIISRLRGYHGVTVASGSLSGQAPLHSGFDLPIANVLHTDAPSFYHGSLPGESEDQFTARLAKNLDDLISREGADTIAAFIAEPVNGSGGVIVPPRGYFESIQEVLKRHDILFIVDEVICGFGRTGNMFGSETFNLKPDLMTVAKQLSGGFIPISATLMTDGIYDVLKHASSRLGTFAHGVTYSAHPVCAAVALETLNIYEERDIIGHVRRVSPKFQTRLKELESHPLAGEARGVGLIGGLEIVLDKASKQHFPLERAISSLVQERTMDHGVIVRGVLNAIAICPPLIITEAQIDELFDGLAAGLDDVAEHVQLDL